MNNTNDGQEDTMTTAFGLDAMELAVRPKPRGRPVNPHIRPAVHEPELDFEAMRRLVLALDSACSEGSSKRPEEEEKSGQR